MDKDISLLAAEKRSLRQFVSVFVTMNIVFLVVLSTLYYYYQKNVYLEVRRNSMIYYAGKVYESLYKTEKLSQIDDMLIRDPRFDVALMSKRQMIAYTSIDDIKVPFKKGFFEYDDHYFYIETIELEKLKRVKYLVIRGKTIDEELAQARHVMYGVLFFSILFFGVLIFALSKLFLKPLREYIQRLDQFIRDATHELNTPISVLSMSLERIDRDGMNSKNIKAIDRMSVAIRTLSHLYDDLTFVMFPQQKSLLSHVRVDHLVQQRVTYFEPIAEAKKIRILTQFEPSEIFANERHIIRIIDNLLSNGIKYNKMGGSITIVVKKEMIEVHDTGIGFDQNEAEIIFVRYKRLDSANGGFGLGLNIVQTICNDYGIKIDVKSEKNKGSVFTLTWSSL